MPTISLYADAQREADSHWSLSHTVIINGREMPLALSQWLLEAAFADYHMARAAVLRKGRAKAGPDARFAFDRGGEVSEFLKASLAEVA